MEDVSTVISILPWAVGPEEKPGLYPGSFFLDPAAKGDMSVLHVGKSHHFFNYDEKSLKIETTSSEVARSIVEDYCSSMIEATPEDKPGLFWLFGQHPKDEIKKVQASRLLEVKASQMRWFARLVRLADDDWSKNRQNRTISMIQREAAKWLGLDREWISDFATQAENRCLACRSMIDPEASICPICHTIVNVQEYNRITGKQLVEAK